jgi:hypothetical protein
MSSHPRALHSPHLALATKACVKALERPMIISPSLMKIKDLDDEINELYRGFGEKLLRWQK